MELDHPAIRERMLELELHGEEYLPLGEFIARLVEIEHSDEFDDALMAEINRVGELWASTYARLFNGAPAARNVVAFCQGVTFAKAVEKLKEGDSVG